MGDKNPRRWQQKDRKASAGRGQSPISQVTGAKPDWSRLRREQEGGNGCSKYTRFLQRGWPWQCIRSATQEGGQLQRARSEVEK